MKPLFELEHVSQELQDRLPPHIKESLDRYAQYGVPTGDCLRSILSNNLSESIARADEDTLKAMRWIIQYIYNALPGCCWGSAETVGKHIEHCRKVRECAEPTT